jgi:putative transferase (TIGR04331 family)
MKKIIFVKKKYNFYNKLFPQALNKIHNKNLPDIFWKKSLSVQFYYILVIFNEFYNDKLIKIKNNNRLNISTFGDLLNNTKKKNFYKTNYRFKLIDTENVAPKQSNFSFKNLLNINSIKTKFLLYLTNFLFFFVKPHILSINHFSDEKIFLKTKLKFFGKINKKSLPKLIINKKNFKMRSLFVKILLKNLFLDKFDIAFFKFLYFYFPSILLESFDDNLSKSIVFFNKFKSLKFILNEDFFNNHISSFYLAVAKYFFNVSHVACEHNVVTNFFKHNDIALYLEHCDLYFSLGWKDLNKKIIPAGSMNKFFIKKNYSFFFIYVTNYARHYSERYWDNLTYQNLHKTNNDQKLSSFFKNLHIDVLEKLKLKRALNINPSFDRSEILSKINRVKYFSKKRILDTSIDLKEYLPNSQLVIFDDPFSTGIIICLKSNIPFLVLCPLDNNLVIFNKYYSKNYSDLFFSEIFFKNYISASKFINKNYQNINEWWYSDKIQSIRRNFIKSTILDHNIFAIKLTNILKNDSKTNSK